MIFNLNILLIYLIIILIIFLSSHSDNNCKEKICIGILLIIIFHISINYLYNEKFTNNDNKNNFILGKTDVLYIIDIIKKSQNDDKLKVIINSSLYNINLLNTNLASNISKVIYISLINIDNVEKMVNTNYNTFIDLIKSIDNFQLPEKIIQTNSTNINISNDNNVFYNLLTAYKLQYNTNIPTLINTQTIPTTITSTITSTNTPTTNTPPTIIPPTFTPPTITTSTITTSTNTPPTITTSTNTTSTNTTSTNNNDILKNLNLLKNKNLDNYDCNDVKKLLNNIINENNDNFKNSLNNIDNKGDFKYNQTNNIMKTLGQNENNWDMSNEYTLLNTNKWALQDTTPFKCKQTCEVCPIMDSKFTLLKNYDESRKVLNPDNINIDYIKDKLNQM